MSTNYRADLVGVFGHPVAENPTCVMLDAAFKQLGLDWRYLTIEVKPAALPEAIRGIRAMGFKGINLTIPHKVAVMPLLDSIADDARLIGAVNTVRREGDRFIGENTDGKGFLRGVRDEAGIDPKGAHIVLLGAGGAARAIAVECALAGVDRITIVNRSAERGAALTDHLTQNLKAAARFVPWRGEFAAGKDTDILVNATSIGLFPDGDTMPLVRLDGLRQTCLVCDVIPNPPDTRFVKTARAQGHKTLTGLPMLVNQGAIGFKMWTGLDAPERVMRAALDHAFGLEH
jgi:shikimate dehydrogenase